jgi:hypothetical protein
MLNSFPPLTADTQFEFDISYSTAHSLLNQFYPERTITGTPRDPQYITPEIKAKLQRKNRLMRAGRVEEAGALAERIGKDLERHSKNRLKTINGKTDVKNMWAAVRQLTGRKQYTGPVPGISAESLNSHYVAISTDNHHTICCSQSVPIHFFMASLPNPRPPPPYCHRTGSTSGLVP